MNLSCSLAYQDNPLVKKRKLFYRVGVLSMVVFFSVFQFLLGEFLPLFIEYFALTYAGELSLRIFIVSTLSVVLHLCWEFVKGKKRKYIYQQNKVIENKVIFHRYQNIDFNNTSSNVS